MFVTPADALAGTDDEGSVSSSTSRESSPLTDTDDLDLLLPPLGVKGPPPSAHNEPETPTTSTPQQASTKMSVGQHRKRKALTPPALPRSGLRRSPRHRDAIAGAIGVSTLAAAEPMKMARLGEPASLDAIDITANLALPSSLPPTPKRNFDLNQLKAAVKALSRQLQDVVVHFFVSISLPRSSRHELLLTPFDPPSFRALLRTCWGPEFASVYSSLYSKQEISSHDCMRALVAAFLYDRVLAEGHTLQPKLYGQLGLQGIEACRSRLAR